MHFFTHNLFVDRNRNGIFKLIKKFTVIFLFVILLIIVCSFALKTAKADDLSDEIDSQINAINIEELKDFFISLEDKPENFDLTNKLTDILTGDFSFEYSDIFDFLTEILIKNLKKYLPLFSGIIAVSIICSVIENYKISNRQGDIFDVILFICKIFVIAFLIGHFITIYKEVGETLNKIIKLCEITTPIILTLLLASGGVASSAVYKPATVFFTNIFLGIISSFIMPLIILFTFFSLFSNINPDLKLNKLSDFFSSSIKWIIGILTTVFGVFLTVQGITASNYDGISFKVAKYAISSSIPIVGGFIKDGFDIVTASSVLIKNAVGFSSLILLFITLISPVIKLFTFSMILKLSTAFSSIFSDSGISSACESFNKSITFFISVLLISAVMTFIIVLLIILSGNIL